MKKHLLIALLSILSIAGFGQTYTLSGEVLDRSTGESLIGATIVAYDNVGTVTNFDGEFSLDLKAGDYSLTISYVGFEQEIKKISLTKNMSISIKLKTQFLDEVSVVADVARSRETPVAFTNVLPAKIEEELGAQDIPMILNSTPGVYATQQGGGDGDARINIRGFNQRNVAVMLDGIPVNDMENGWVYWSNWFGLDAVTRTIQVQRGLGASKLALPSVGGTMNIITKGLDNKKEYSVKHEVDSEGKFRSSLGYTSGRLKNDWGITLATSFKKGDGYVDETPTQAFFYYAKVDKRIKNHIISFSAMGAPQEHGQRAYKNAIATFDSTYASSLGVDTFPSVVNRGIRYNANWGSYYLTGAPTDSIVHPVTGQATYTAYDTISGPLKTHYKTNKYHKPAFSLRDFWTVSDKFSISNILYLSKGHGGGTGTKSSLKLSDLDENGQINWQNIYDGNKENLDTNYNSVSGNYRIINMNDHLWYGLLSTFNYDYNDSWDFSGGVDIRSYTGSHYREVYDLMGGDYCEDNWDANQESNVKRVGDKVYFNDDVSVRWGGVFGQAEFKTERFSSFINLSGARTGFNKENFFALPEDTARNSGWIWKTSYTAKGGANFNIDRFSNVFVNMGYLSKTRASKYIFEGYTTQFRENTDNEVVQALELGYSFASPMFSMNLNGYYTRWNNVPMNDISTAEGFIRIPGIDQLHKGIEFDFIYKIAHNLDFQGLASIGDWRFKSKPQTVTTYDEYENIEGTFTFDPYDVHVGDAAQTQYAGSLRFEPLKGLYLSTRYTFFDRYYADLDPASLNGEGYAINDDGSPRDSWQMPSYGLLDFNTGYTYYYDDFKVSFRLSVFNVLDDLYISDARNNDSYIYGTPPGTFDVNAASVFLGLGRRYNASVKITF